MVIKQGVYDGNLIHNRFAYEYFRKDVSPYGNIVAFRAPMYVKDALIDLEDTLSNDFIHSQDAINFCWEIPGLCPFGAVSFQRLFNKAIANIYICKLQQPKAKRKVLFLYIILKSSYISPEQNTGVKSYG